MAKGTPAILLQRGKAKSEPPVGAPAARAWGSEGNDSEDQWRGRFKSALCGAGAALNRIKVMHRTRLATSMVFSALAGLASCS